MSWYNILSKTQLVRHADNTTLAGFDIEIRRTSIGGGYYQLVLVDKNGMVILL